MKKDPWLLDSVEHLNRAIDLLNRHGDVYGLAIQVSPRNATPECPATAYGKIAEAIGDLLGVIVSDCRDLVTSDRELASVVDQLGDLISPGGSDMSVVEAVKFASEDVLDEAADMLSYQVLAEVTWPR